MYTILLSSNSHYIFTMLCTYMYYNQYRLHSSLNIFFFTRISRCQWYRISGLYKTKYGFFNLLFNIYKLSLNYTYISYKLKLTNNTIFSNKILKSQFLDILILLTQGFCNRVELVNCPEFSTLILPSASYFKF